MNFQSMEYFVALAQEKNFTRAAERLHITQQSLSAHIASVEKELGCQLLIRHVPLELTFAGRAFLRYATAYQRSFHTLKQEFCDIADNQKGELRAGISATRSHIIMPDLITAFQKEWPNIEIIVYEGSELTKHVLEGELDLAIMNFTSTPPDMEFLDFYEEEIVLLITKELLERLSIEPSEIKEAIAAGHLDPLKECPFLLGDPIGTATQAGLELFRRSGFSPVVKAQSNNMNTLLALCSRNVGACLSPLNMARAMLSPRRLSRLEMFHLPGNFRYPIRFGFLKRAYQWSMISEFIRVARATYPKEDKQPIVWQ